EELRRRFSSPTHQLAALLTDDYEDIEERADVGWEEYQQIKADRLAWHIEGYGADDFDRLIDECVIIRVRSPGTQAAVGRQSPDDFRVKAGVGSLFAIVAARDPGLFEHVVRRYLARRNALELGPHPS